jgi:maltooligosyltrehalose synthase
MTRDLTAPVMAKGVEDAAFYRYNRLGNLNAEAGARLAVAALRADFPIALLIASPVEG